MTHTIFAREIPPDYILVPCPYCDLEGNHRGTCELSYQRSGVDHIVIALPCEIVGPDLTTSDSSAKPNT